MPDDWITICGKTENLSAIYDEIYKDGPLLYEIEEFDDKGNCKIRYCRYILILRVKIIIIYYLFKSSVCDVLTSYLLTK